MKKVPGLSPDHAHRGYSSLQCGCMYTLTLIDASDTVMRVLRTHVLYASFERASLT